MTDEILSALSSLPAFVGKQTGEKAEKLPVITVNLISDEGLFRCDGQDYLRRFLYQVNVFSLSREEGLSLSKGARHILCRPPFCFEREQENMLFDGENRVFQCSARYGVTAEMKED